MDKKLEYLKEAWSRLEEGFFGGGKRKLLSRWNTIEAIKDQLEAALEGKDGKEFRFFIGKGLQLAMGVAELIGLSKYVRPSDVERTSFDGEISELHSKTVELFASFQVLCVDDGERHKMRMFLSSIDPRKVAVKLPTLASWLEELDKSSIEGFDLKGAGFGDEVASWLASMDTKRS